MRKTGRCGSELIVRKMGQGQQLEMVSRVRSSPVSHSFWRGKSEWSSVRYVNLAKEVGR